MTTKRVHMISLGCPKNRVDSEVMVGLIQGDAAIRDGRPMPMRADIVVVNTCGFIENAKKESIDTILGDDQPQADRGAASTRWSSRGVWRSATPPSWRQELPEVDAFLGTKTFTSINRALRGRARLAHLHRARQLFDVATRVARTNTIRGGTAYLKIAEGCSRKL